MSAKPVIPCILPTEFTAFATILAGDDSFPKTCTNRLPTPLFTRREFALQTSQQGRVRLPPLAKVETSLY